MTSNIRGLPLVFIAVLAFSCTGGPDSSADSDALQPEDCLQSYGDNCGCDAQCLTAADIAAIDPAESCEDTCSASGSDWQCGVRDGECFVSFYYD